MVLVRAPLQERASYDTGVNMEQPPPPIAFNRDSKNGKASSTDGGGSPRDKNAAKRGKDSSAVALQLTKTKMCAFYKDGKCVSADCRYAHSQSELRDAPNLQKTKLCKAFLAGCCSSGENCGFAHGEKELRFTASIYKTQMCNFFARGYCKKGTRCNHAHGKEDLRPTGHPANVASHPMRSNANPCSNEIYDSAASAAPSAAPPAALHLSELVVANVDGMVANHRPHTMTAQANLMPPVMASHNPNTMPDFASVPYAQFTTPMRPPSGLWYSAGMTYPAAQAQQQATIVVPPPNVPNIDPYGRMDQSALRGPTRTPEFFLEQMATGVQPNTGPTAATNLPVTSNLPPSMYFPAEPYKGCNDIPYGGTRFVAEAHLPTEAARSPASPKGGRRSATCLPGAAPSIYSYPIDHKKYDEVSSCGDRFAVRSEDDIGSPTSPKCSNDSSTHMTQTPVSSGFRGFPTPSPATGPLRDVGLQLQRLCSPAYDRMQFPQCAGTPPSADPISINLNGKLAEVGFNGTPGMS